ncbi:MAG TPA: hypothetical protein VN631_08995 [Negativicutes bacterium]|nr:hypothetical protein [Negativicutes bacterium]
MNKAKLVVLIITILLLLTGVAYARWTEQVNIQILAKTAETELSYVDYDSRMNSGTVTVSNGENTQATVVFKEITPDTGNSVTLRFKNTGTIPIDIDDINVRYVGGYSDDYKNDLTLTVSGYAGEKRFLQQDKKIFQWRANNSSSKRDELYQLPVNGVIEIICEIEFDEIKVIDNYGQDKKEDSKKGIDASDIKQDVSFIIEVDYSRFNQS